MPETIALLGGTGRSGPGLALRLALAGRRIHIGSRDPEKGRAAAAEIRDTLAGVAGAQPAEVTGHDNREAAELADIAMITVPYEGMGGLLRGVEPALRDKVVISTVVPMLWSRELGPTALDVPEGSAAEQAAELLPASRVVAGFHSLSSATLKRLDHPIDSHVIVTGDDDHAKQIAMEIAELLPGVRGVNGGALRYARHSEGLTVLLLSINSVYKRHTGVIITDLP
jgi:NADPH-dependent F420 reductase